MLIYQKSDRYDTLQQAERSEGRLGFGGSAPCAQTHGSQKFITKHPLDYQIDAISAGVTHKKPGLYGANKHEGSFVLGGIKFVIKF